MIREKLVKVWRNFGNLIDNFKSFIENFNKNLEKILTQFWNFFTSILILAAQKHLCYGELFSGFPPRSHWSCYCCNIVFVRKWKGVQITIVHFKGFYYCNTLLNYDCIFDYFMLFSLCCFLSSLAFNNQIKHFTVIQNFGGPYFFGGGPYFRGGPWGRASFASMSRRPWARHSHRRTLDFRFG